MKLNGQVMRGKVQKQVVYISGKYLRKEKNFYSETYIQNALSAIVKP